MEKKINCKVLEKKYDGANIKFDIESLEKKVTYCVRNCDLVPSDEESVKMGYKCYHGNVELKIKGVDKDISARLWVRDTDCVLVYNE